MRAPSLWTPEGDARRLQHTRRQDALVEARAQRRRRRELVLAVCAALQALVAFEAGHGREVERRLDEAERYARLAIPAVAGGNGGAADGKRSDRTKQNA